MHLAALRTEYEGSEIAGPVLDFVGVPRRGCVRAGWAEQPRFGPSVDRRFLDLCPLPACRGARFPGVAALVLQFGQQPGHVVGVFGHRAGQHGPDLRDVGAART